MKVNHVLIDYENVQPQVAEALARPIFNVWVFVGAQQAKVSFDLVNLLQTKGDAAKVIKMGGTGRNALDFHMSYYLGGLVKDHPDGYFHLVTEDTGMDPLVEHLRSMGLQVNRWRNITDMPLLKRPALLPDEEKLSCIIEYLVRRGAQRPSSMKTLIGSISAQFQPKLDSDEAKALADTLQAHGIFEVVGSKLRYGLPD